MTTMEVKIHRMSKKTQKDISRFMKSKQKPSDSLGILPNRHTGTACKRAEKITHPIIISILYFEEGMKKKSLTSYCLVEKCFPLQQYLRSMLNDNK